MTYTFYSNNGSKKKLALFNLGKNSAMPMKTFFQVTQEAIIDNQKKNAFIESQELDDHEKNEGVAIKYSFFG